MVQLKVQFVDIRQYLPHFATRQKYRAENLIKLWNHFLHLDVNRLHRKIFEWDYSAVGTSWSSEVKNILEDSNLTHVFEDKIVCDLNECETRLRENVYRDRMENGKAKCNRSQNSERT